MGILGTSPDSTARTRGQSAADGGEGPKADPNAPRPVPGDTVPSYLTIRLSDKEKEEDAPTGRHTQGEVLTTYWVTHANPRTWCPLYTRNPEIKERGERQYYLAGPPERSDWLAAVLDGLSYTDTGGKNSVQLRHDRYGEVKRPLMESKDFSDKNEPVKLTPLGRKALDELLPAIWESIGRVPIGIVDDVYERFHSRESKKTLAYHLRTLALTGDPKETVRKINVLFFPMVVTALESRDTTFGDPRWTYDARPRDEEKLAGLTFADFDERVDGEFREYLKYRKDPGEFRTEIFQKHCDNARWISDWLRFYVQQNDDRMAAVSRRSFTSMLKAVKADRKLTWGKARDTAERDAGLQADAARRTLFRQWLEYFRGEEIWRLRLARAGKEKVLPEAEAAPDWVTSPLP